MITSEKFDLIRYAFPNLSGKGEEITDITGIDTEAYTTGEPFIVCLSDGRHVDPKGFFDFVKRPRNAGHYGAWNLKYDSGALLYYLPDERKVELWEKTFTQYDGLYIEYIPHKYLSFKVKKSQQIKIWDIFQYYRMSLDKAAEIYLHDRKIEVGTKKFTPEYVKKHFKELKRYCVKDAKLTALLAMFLINKLSEFGVRSTALYSSASLSFRYFSDRTTISTAWRYWKHYRESLAYAIDSYQGGKFEVTVRGYIPHAYEYDIVSAYPFEIARLVDISLARVVKNSEYEPEAEYGYIRCKVYNPEGKYLPCGVLMKNVRVYPAGEFYLTITKDEYDYLTEIGIKIDIISAYWLFVRVKKYPYQKVISELFSLKARYKGNDKMLYEVSKRMMNSFYGKTCQLIENWKGEYHAGTGWNPFHAAVITARTRIQVCRIQNFLGPSCLGVHTDSVITDKPLPDELLDKKLGGFILEEQGAALIVACGQYLINDKGAYKGFEPAKGENWRTILSAMKGRSVLPYPYIKVESWTDAVSKGHFSTINKFTEETKKIDLNADIKRVWPQSASGKRLLETRQESYPKIVIHLERPEVWSKDYAKEAKDTPHR